MISHDQMKRCKAQLVYSKQKCSRATNTDHYKQPKLDEKLLYFNGVPIELLRLLILHLSSTDICKIFDKSCLKRIKKDNELWQKLWARDISSFIPLPKYDYKQYRQVSNDVNNFRRDAARDKYIVERGYDILFLQSLPKMIVDDSYWRWRDAIIEATRSNYVPFVKSLICLYDDYEDDTYDSVMYKAIRCGHIEIIKLLIDTEFELNESYLYSAIYYDKIEIAKYMVKVMEENNSIINYRPFLDFTISMKVCNLEMVKFFMEKDHTDHDTIIRIANSYGRKEVIKSLKN